MKRLIMLLSLAILLFSCYSSKTLHNTGTYTVKTKSGHTTTFEEVKGKYVIVSDTLKVNDKVFINVIKSHK